VHRPRHRGKTARRQPETESINDGDEDLEGRQSWFLFQRTYPFGSIPVDARRAAWESRPGRGKSEAQSESVTAPVWQSLGPTPTLPYFGNFGFNSGRINALAVSPTDANLILAGAATGGIWRSADGGANFVPVSDGQVDLAVGSLVFSKSNPDIVYAGMGDMQGCCTYMGSGILKSTDAGQTWTRVNNSSLPQPGAIGALAVDPNNPNRVYAALYRSLDATNANSFPFGGFYLSTDGGVNWTNTLVGLPRDVIVSPANPQTIYVAMRGLGASGNGGTGGVFRSTDGGNTWNIIYTSAFPPAFTSGGLRDIRVAVSAANPQKIYVYSGNSASPVAIRVDVSTDGGNNWTNLGAPGLDSGQFGYNTYLYADPANADTVYVGTRDVFKSTDAGVTWTNLTKSNSPYSYSVALAHPDQHSLAFSPMNSNVIYIGNDGGVYKSPDGGSSFQSLNATLSLTQFVSIARHPTDPAITYGGTQDNGTQKRTNVIPTQWRDFAGGDGGHCVVNPLDPTIVFATYVHGRIWRYNNNGDTFGGTIATDGTFKDDNNANERTAFYPPFVGNGVNAQIYFGSQRVWTSTNLGATWTPTGTTADLTQGGTDVLNAISVARSDANVIYTGSAQGRAMVSTDGGQNWTEVTAGLPNRTITWFAIDNANPSNAYVSTSGFGSGHVFKTANRGQSWTDVSGNLPNIPTSALLIDPNDPNTIYAGTDIGVFRSTTGGTNWSSFNDGLPPVVVMGFATNNSGQIQIATYGRGAYQMTSSQRFSISGRVADGFGNGISGATVTLSGTVSANTTTDGNGNYSFSNLPAGGNYSLAPSKAGQYFGFGGDVNNLSSNMTGVNLRLDLYVRIDAHTTDAGGNDLGGVAIDTGNSFFGGPKTNAFGRVTILLGVPSVAGTQITVTPSKLGYAFNPQTFTFNSQSGNQNPTFAAIPPNAMDDPPTFVTQQYRDFLNRDPDPSGLDYWTSQITNCGADVLCIHHKRIDVSNAFFFEQEYQKTGAYAYRLYRVAFGNNQPKPNPFPDTNFPGENLKIPSYDAFKPDRAAIDASNLAQSQLDLANTFVGRPEFVAEYPASLATAQQFVDAVLATVSSIGVDLSAQRTNLINLYGTLGRGGVMYRLADDNVTNPISNGSLINAEYNRAFVYSQYSGYLRRDSDIRGFLFWLGQVNGGPLRDVTKQHAMVCSFITSAEYQLRFDSSITRTNRDCSQ
jgi:photosystem II stability/assembly factor-like uncharacterized protein